MAFSVYSRPKSEVVQVKETNAIDPPIEAENTSLIVPKPFIGNFGIGPSGNVGIYHTPQFMQPRYPQMQSNIIPGNIYPATQAGVASNSFYYAQGSNQMVGMNNTYVNYSTLNNQKFNANRGVSRVSKVPIFGQVSSNTFKAPDSGKSLLVSHDSNGKSTENETPSVEVVKHRKVSAEDVLLSLKTIDSPNSLKRKEFEDGNGKKSREENLRIKRERERLRRKSKLGEQKLEQSDKEKESDTASENDSTVKAGVEVTSVSGGKNLPDEELNPVDFWKKNFVASSSDVKFKPKGPTYGTGPAIIPFADPQYRSNHAESIIRAYAEKRFECQLCKVCFGTCKDYEEHARIHPGHLPFTCSACGAQFRHACSGSRHIRIKHSSIVCEVCNVTFDTEKELEAHNCIQ